MTKEIFLHNLGKSEADGIPVKCEQVKMIINSKIESDEFKAFGSLEEFNEYDEFYWNTHEFDESIFNTNAPRLSEWLDCIDKDAHQMVASSDDGNRDNILENKPFAKHFLRLCKLLPLWSGISCKFFDTPYATGSSWQSETWYKNLKQMHGSQIPSSVDEFLERDLRLTNSHVILASRKYSTTERKKTKVTNVDDSNVLAEEMHEELIKTDEDSDNDEIDHVKCIACERGDFPTGQHTCVMCSKAIHLLDGCSIDIGAEEGCGQQRLCVSCNANRKRKIQTEPQPSTSGASQSLPSKSQTIQEMNYADVWKKKKDVKHSKYMKPMPNWSLVGVQQKVKIGHLINGNRSTTIHKVKGVSVNLQNTCAVDCVIQLLAASYAYNSSYKSFVDTSAKDDIFEIVKLLARK